MNWQPIETAPTDGRSIDVWNGTRVVNAMWARPEGHIPEFQCWCYYEPIPEGRYGAVIHELWRVDPEPTHWMPLPEPPQ